MNSLTKIAGLDELRSASMYGNDNIGMLLYSLAFANHCKRIVEIGYNMGYSAVFLCAGAVDGANGDMTGVRVVSIDIAACDGGQIVKSQPFGAVHTFIQGDSKLIAPQVMDVLGAPISLLFIDGSHEHSDVLADWHAYNGYLSEDALVLFHDSDTGGVQMVIDEICGGVKGFPPDSLTPGAVMYDFVHLGGWASLAVGRKQRYGKLGMAHT